MGKRTRKNLYRVKKTSAARGSAARAVAVRLAAMLIAAAMAFQLIGVNTLVAKAADHSSSTSADTSAAGNASNTESKSSAFHTPDALDRSAEVTRLEWLKELAEIFQLTVEEDNYPDNYYSDIDDSFEGYYEVMLATEFGLVDVKAGEAFRPGEAATRKFAAHTLNLCLGYVLEDKAYTFAEAEKVENPEDIQIAVNQGWFSLENGKFLPEKSITRTEKEAMLSAAREVHAKDSATPDNQGYTYRDDVIVLPEETELVASGEDEITITDCPHAIQVGDIFGKVCEGIPLAWEAKEVQVNGSQTVIKISMVNSEEAFEQISVSQEVEADLSKLRPA